MTTNFRSLCAELAEKLDEYGRLLHGPQYVEHPLTWRARTALAEPQPKPPTKAELKQLFNDCSGYIDDEQVMWWSDFHAAARAVLARWGRPSLKDIEENEDYRIVSPEFYNAACAVLEHRSNNPETPDRSDPSVKGEVQ